MHSQTGKTTTNTTNSKKYTENLESADKDKVRSYNRTNYWLIRNADKLKTTTTESKLCGVATQSGGEKKKKKKKNEVGESVDVKLLG